MSTESLTKGQISISKPSHHLFSGILDCSLHLGGTHSQAVILGLLGPRGVESLMSQRNITAAQRYRYWQEADALHRQSNAAQRYGAGELLVICQSYFK